MLSTFHQLFVDNFYSVKLVRFDLVLQQDKRIGYFSLRYSSTHTQSLLTCKASIVCFSSVFRSGAPGKLLLTFDRGISAISQDFAGLVFAGYSDGRTLGRH